VSGWWQAERGRLPREDPRAEVGEDVRVGVGPMEFSLSALIHKDRQTPTLNA